MLQSIFKRPARTVLVDTGTARFRVDLSRQSGRFCVDRMMNDSGSVASAAVSDGADDPLGEGLPQDDGRWVTALLRQKPRPAAEVTLLSARVAAAVFEVPFMGGESEEEAIAMELESLTGLGTAKTQWTWKRLPGSDGLLKAWASQASLEQLMVWRQAVSAIRSCHLVAVTHPAGLPLEAESQLELWPGFALFQPFDGGAGEMQSWPGERAADSALADEGIRDAISQEALVVLTAGGRLPRELKGCPVLDLEEEAGRMRWGDRLARALDPLSQKLEMLPRLMIPKPEMTMRQLVITTFGVTGVAALVAIGHFAFLKASINHLDVQVAALRVPVDEVREGEKEIRELRRQLRTGRKGRAV